MCTCRPSNFAQLVREEEAEQNDCSHYRSCGTQSSEIIGVFDSGEVSIDRRDEGRGKE